VLNAGIVQARIRSGGRADVYLDVSGSVDAMLPHLYGALSTLRMYVSPKVHLFSTRVQTIGLDRLCAGEVRTTGGTDLACVLRHVANERPKKVLIITDGYVGAPGAALAKEAAAACGDIRVLLTPGGWRTDLTDIASRIDELPTLGGTQ
jgi:hypothetical protein